jgi:hypothetical protein
MGQAMSRHARSIWATEPLCRAVHRLLESSADSFGAVQADLSRLINLARFEHAAKFFIAGWPLNRYTISAVMVGQHAIRFVTTEKLINVCILRPIAPFQSSSIIRLNGACLSPRKSIANSRDSAQMCVANEITAE